MQKTLYRLLPLLILTVLFTALSGCTQSEQAGIVVVYTSVDQPVSEPILEAFTAETGIEIQAVYDVEAAKTTGLVNRLIAEKDNPQADVFWNGEFAQTILLKEEGVLQPYWSPDAADIPSYYKDEDGTWTAFAGRARVFIVNIDLLNPDEYPDSIEDMLDPVYPADRIGIAYPLFGTAATHAASLYVEMGEVDARSFFEALAARGVQVVDGNSVVRDLVAAGELAFGLTDTDDACAAVENGEPVAIVFPDQGEGERGTLVLPNTVAMINGAPHREEAQAFIDYLLSVETAQELIESGWSQLSLRPLSVSPGCVDTSAVRTMPVGLIEIYQQFEPVKQELMDIFIR
ncbi:MAG: extracellular solute-binding protein [Anaerolineales bacterium]|nr:extracellular solute-binding protein [Anaerolineales bacterium]